MADDIGNILARQVERTPVSRDDARARARAERVENSPERAGAGRNSPNPANTVSDQVNIQNRTLIARDLSNQTGADEAIQSDSRLVNLSGALTTVTILQESLEDAVDIIEDLRAASRAGDTGATQRFEQEFYQNIANFSAILQDGERAGNHLLTSDISRLQVDIPEQSEPLVIEGRNILETTENGGVFEAKVFSSRGDLEAEQLAQYLGAESPLALAELPEQTLASLQYFVANARDNISNLRHDLNQDLTQLSQILRVAQAIQETQADNEAAIDAGANNEQVNEERASLLALQTRLQLQELSDGILHQSRDDVLQFFR